MTQTAYVLVSCMMGQEHSILEQIRTIPQVKTAIITYGEYDIVAKIETSTAQEMAEIISSQIRQIQKIRSTITLHVI
ncbi:Lrp/AsnC ligand binding domain-containing protein [Candidatus Nitrosotenuis aquarius]|jgi:DNA-binding Lrp family transcriptional regulator|uniref:Lrp/AsnC ligand binding domain-containing protein n=1 Tax=Candidatus Nitrosotenuis aquarius TaxID=1846278 RepID=UPI000C1F0BAD|nr:Lrp/AsnC ligand binding domain-containing protein [Candidatus Nitrosotenuis aquarius]